MKPILIKQGHLIDPGQKTDAVGDLHLQRGYISKTAPAPRSEAAIEINAKGMIVCPGFIDLHCHLREPGYEAKETIQSGTLSLIHI